MIKWGTFPREAIEAELAFAIKFTSPQRLEALFKDAGICNFSIKPSLLPDRAVQLLLDSENGPSDFSGFHSRLVRAGYYLYVTSDGDIEARKDD